MILMKGRDNSRVYALRAVPRSAGHLSVKGHPEASYQAYQSSTRRSVIERPPRRYELSRDGRIPVTQPNLVIIPTWALFQKCPRSRACINDIRVFDPSLNIDDERTRRGSWYKGFILSVLMAYFAEVTVRSKGLLFRMSKAV